MRAVVWTGYGSDEVLQLKEIKTPTPKGNEVLVRIHAATVTSGDCEQRALKLPFWYKVSMRAYVGLRKPTRITSLGMDFAGQIESVGPEVKRFQKGDQVFGSTGFVHMGTTAEYVCLPEQPEEGAIAHKPKNMTFNQAACVPTGGMEALCFLRNADLTSGQTVLINGAGGTIGPFAVQVAKHFGATVTAVDSKPKLGILQSLGADHVIDYKQEDFTKKPNKYDLIVDLIGKSPFSGSLNCLNKNGRYLIANPNLSQMIRGRWVSFTGSKKVMFGNVKPKTEDLVFLKELIEAGKLKAVIDKTFPLEQTAHAHRYVESGQKIGNVIVVIDQNDVITP